MGFRTGAYAKVWKVNQISDVVTEINISVSRKNRNSGEYEREFSGFARCIGTSAATKALKLSEGDTIKLGDVDVTNTYVAEKNTTYVNYKIFSFEEVNNTPKQEEKSVDDGEVVVDVEEEPSSDLPF